MFVITSGEVVERLNWAISSANDPLRMLLAHSKKVPEKKVNIELALIGPGDIAGELPFVKAKWLANFDIKAVTDVQTLAIDRRYFETNMLSATPESNRAVYSTLQTLKKISREREDWRQQRLECGSAYPNAHISMYVCSLTPAWSIRTLTLQSALCSVQSTWQLMRMSNLRCPRCGVRGHLATDTARCGNPPSGPLTSTLAIANGTQRKSKAAIGVHRKLLAKLSVAPPLSSRYARLYTSSRAYEGSDRRSERQESLTLLCGALQDGRAPARHDSARAL